MVQIKPFKALMYNPKKAPDLSRVLCPPYDIIPPAAQTYYHDLDPYNFIRLELGKDIKGESKYKRAKELFKEWQKDKVLIQDEAPSLYFHSQQYTLKGELKERLGFFALLHLGEKKSLVFSHEHTRPEPKEDRLRLLRQVKANLSPLFLVFPDTKRIIQRLYHYHAQDGSALLKVTDKDKVSHKLWKIDAPEVISAVQAAIQKEDVFIADGHHRFETACAYRDIRKKRRGEAFTGEESFNFVLAYFTNAPSRGLSILPVHRLVRVGPKFDFEKFKGELAEHFDIEDKIGDRARFSFLMEKGGGTEHVLGMYRDGKYHLLRLKNIRILEKIAHDKPKEYRSLDVSILNHLVLRKALGMDIEDKENISFSPYADEFIAKVDQSHSTIAFILNPVKMQEILGLALSGERMPSKSTYFYPKLLSGLVVHKFD